MDLDAIAAGSAPLALKESKRISLYPFYFHSKLKGARDAIYGRKSVIRALEAAANSLPPGYGFIVYDVFRFIETQTDLYAHYERIVKSKHPGTSAEELRKATTTYVAYPSQDPSSVSPHNTGGSIDLGLTYHGEICPMGTEFDEFCGKARTDYFEGEPHAPFSLRDWELIQNNRRILFNAMTFSGFTNYREEWWHYDLGNRIWAKNLGLIPVYASMEADLNDILGIT